MGGKKKAMCGFHNSENFKNGEIWEGLFRDYQFYDTQLARYRLFKFSKFEKSEHQSVKE